MTYEEASMVVDEALSAERARHVRIVQQAVAAERERCAKIVSMSSDLFLSRDNIVKKIREGWNP